MVIIIQHQRCEEYFKKIFEHIKIEVFFIKKKYILLKRI